VSRAIGLAALGLIGCGRLGFGSPPPADDAAAAIDAPPVPESICKVDRIPLAVPAMADLAITGTSAGYSAIWVDPTGATEAHGVVLARNHQLAGSLALPAIKDTRLGGLTDLGAKLVLSTGDGVFQATWTLDPDLTTASAGPRNNDFVMAHGQYPSDASQTPRAFVTATGTSMTAAYIASDGTINAPSTVSHGTAGRVTDLACADGPDHAHCTWVEALSTINGASQCTASDVKLRPVLSIPGGPILSGDCYNVRTSSGPDAADSLIAVWTTSDRRVEARYVGTGGLDLVHSVAPAGSAPKVQFDGALFWIAWLDGRDALQLASFDVKGAIKYYSLAGWVPIGPEAFELVRRGNETALVLVSRDGLDILTICT